MQMCESRLQAGAPDACKELQGDLGMRAFIW